jgi:NADPH:quinone reductase-like Zn-dependent oxidoreductase
MRAMQVNSTGEPRLLAADLPQPQPGKGELLIQVRAAGVTPTELGWYPTTHHPDGTPRNGAVPGHEFSGEVVGVGEGAQGFQIGQEIYGLNDWFADGATAEFCLTQPQNIASKPSTLSHSAAATVPIGALTAWQGLLERAKIRRGERVLVHGAGGSVGMFAVQLAHLQGAHVIATASSRNLDVVAAIGADEVIDYRASRFEDQAGKVDVVFDGVGGETLDRSWGVLKAGGRLVTIVEQASKNEFFIVEPNQKQLIEIARLLDDGTLKTFVGANVPLKDAASAYDGTVLKAQAYGKVVLTID